jgi:hypothetical protein
MYKGPAGFAEFFYIIPKYYVISMTDLGVDKAFIEKASGKITATKAMRKLGIKITTFSLHFGPSTLALSLHFLIATSNKKEP